MKIITLFNAFDFARTDLHNLVVLIDVPATDEQRRKDGELFRRRVRQSETFAAAIRARLADIETENAQLREDLRLVSLERDRYLSGVRMAASSVRRQEPAADHSINEVLNITAGQGDWNINPPTEVAA